MLLGAGARQVSWSSASQAAAGVAVLYPFIQYPTLAAPVKHEADWIDPFAVHAAQFHVSSPELARGCSCSQQHKYPKHHREQCGRNRRSRLDPTHILDDRDVAKSSINFGRDIETLIYGSSQTHADLRHDGLDRPNVPQSLGLPHNRAHLLVSKFYFCCTIFRAICSLLQPT